MIAITYRAYRLASALRHHAPRQLTPGGLIVAAALVLTGSASVDMDRTVAYQAFALLACVLGVSVACKIGHRGRYQARRFLPRLASVGQPLRYRVEVRNLGRRARSGLEVFEDLEDPRPGRREFRDWLRPAGPQRTFRLRRRTARFRSRDFRRATAAPVPLPPLPPGAVRETTIEVRPLRRGILRFAGLSIARPDPLGLVRSFRRVPLPQSVVVLPKRYPLPPLALGGNSQYQPGGVALAAAVGESPEFISLRDYRPGDPLRHIHWRSWARTGKPIVREYQDEFIPRHALVLDTFASSAHDDAFEEAVSVAASFACTVDTRDSLLDLLFVGAQAICFTTGRGLGRAEQALEVLAAVQRNPDQPFETLPNLVLRHAPVVCSWICVFLKWDAPRRDLVRRLREFGRPVLTLVVAGEPGEHGDTGAADEGPAPDVHILQPGRIAEGLQKLQGIA